ncbi:hypothetical protein BDV59DRAFT_204751 [Aspergillus ambiguus]|uniref:uncharacterized protein n=1 Tax=Aspergillus ambiguus TaxID=176160 RepID=UPI003CCCE6D1
MSTVRRSKAMPTDGPTAKFLYAIIKQLDLKSIDWNLVASQLEISNGHAARMRYSRFRQQMEGVTSTPRSSRPKKTPGKGKTGSSKADMEKDVISSQPQHMIKQEPQIPVQEPNPHVKSDQYDPNFTLADIPHVSSQTHVMATSPSHPFITTYPMSLPSGDFSMYVPAPSFPGPVIGFERPPAPQHIWAPVKVEPEEGGSIDDVLIKIERPEEQGMTGGSEVDPKIIEMASNANVEDSG